MPAISGACGGCVANLARVSARVPLIGVLRASNIRLHAHYKQQRRAKSWYTSKPESSFGHPEVIPRAYAATYTPTTRGLKGEEHVEQNVFCQAAKEPQGRLDLCGLAELSQVFRYTRLG